MNKNIQGDFQICISVPLMWNLRHILISYEAEADFEICIRVTLKI